MSAVAVREEEIAARETQRDHVRKAFRLGFSPHAAAAQLLVSSRRLSALDASLHQPHGLDAAEGVGWWNAWRLWKPLRKLFRPGHGREILAALRRHGCRHAGVRSDRILAGLALATLFTDEFPGKRLF